MKGRTSEIDEDEGVVALPRHTRVVANVGRPRINLLGQVRYIKAGRNQGPVCNRAANCELMEDNEEGTWL
jgi:hypothetical protein